MAGKAKTFSATQRHAIATLLTQGMSIRAIAAAIGCSPATVQSVKNKMKDPDADLDQDRREFNKRDAIVPERIWELVAQIRQETKYGPRMIWAMLRRNHEKYGIELEEVPSTKTILRYLQGRGLTEKLAGKMDNRGWPIDFDDDLGVVAIDGHGPMRWGSDDIYAVTVQDRHSRLSMAVPTLGRKQAMGNAAWIHAIMLAEKHIMNSNPDENGDPQHIKTVFCDNGEMGIANGHTKQAMRYALQLGARCVLNAPGKPYKNGRLENWHHRLDVEYFEMMRIQNDREKKEGTRTRITDTRRVMDGFITWINQYNVERPHSKLGYKAPADHYGFMPYTPGDAQIPDYPALEPQAGIVDVIRLVWNSGRIELWGEDEMQIQDMLGGQYVRLRFHCDPDAEQQYGRVIWQKSQKSEPIVVAIFLHKMDRPRKKNEPFITDITFLDIDEKSPDSVLSAEAIEIIKRQKLNEYQVRRQYAKVTKKKERFVEMNQEELPGMEGQQPTRIQTRAKRKRTPKIE